MRRMVDKHKMILGLAARYLVITGGEMTAEKVYQNMTFKSGKFAHKSTQCSSLLTLQAKMSKHPVFTKVGTRPYTYTCTLKEYNTHFDDDPYYDWKVIA